VTGVSGTAYVGSVTVTNPRVVYVTGVQAVGYVGNVLVWSEIVPNQNPSWTAINDSQTPNWIRIAT
jgi:hypothetical protein